jgi:hypothetical protein
MSRAQCIVHREKEILMVKHRHDYESRGFRLEALLKDFWEDGNAVMYSQFLKF